MKFRILSPKFKGRCLCTAPLNFSNNLRNFTPTEKIRKRSTNVQHSRHSAAICGISHSQKKTKTRCLCTAPLNFSNNLRNFTPTEKSRKRSINVQHSRHSAAVCGISHQWRKAESEVQMYSTLAVRRQLKHIKKGK